MPFDTSTVADEDAIKSSFVKDYEAMTEKKASLTPDNALDFVEAENAVVDDAIAMLRSGENAIEDGGNIVFFVNGTEYNVLADKISKKIGPEQYSMFFDDDSDEEASEEINNEKSTDHTAGNTVQGASSNLRQDKRANHSEDANQNANPYMQYPQSLQMQASPMMNPFAAMMTYMMNPFMGMYQNPMGQAEQAGRSADTAFTAQPSPIANVYADSKPVTEQADHSIGNLSGLAKSVAEIQDWAEKLEKERKSSEEHISYLKKKIKKTSAELEEHLAREKQLEQDISNSSQSLTDMKKQSDEMKENMSVLKNEKNSYLKQIEELKKQSDNLKQQIEAARLSADEDKKKSEGIISEYEQKLKDAELKAAKAEEKSKDTSESDKRISELESKLKEKDSLIDQSKKQARDAQDRLKNIQKKTDELRSELNSAKKQLSDTETKMAGMQEVDSEKVEYYKNLEAEVKELRSVAYEDALVGTMSSNAFNRDIKNADLHNTVLARVGVRGMKEINAEYGKDSGDNALSIVAESLITAFGKESVYRVMGDNFLIMTAGTQDSEIKQDLSMIADSLAKQSIHIAYGVAVGAMVGSLPALVNAAEIAMNNMKKNGAPEPPADTEPTKPKSRSKTNSPKKNEPDDETPEMSLDEQIISNYDFDDD